MMRPVCLIVLLFAAALASLAVNVVDQVKAEPNAAKRSEMAIEYAEQSLDQARSYYKAGNAARGDSELHVISALADECFSSVQEANKPKYWKKTEMKIGTLTRRVRSLTEDLGYDQRDGAIQLADHLNQIRDKLLQGAMKK